MTYYDLTGLFWWIFGVINTLVFIWLFRSIGNIMRMREEYMSTLDDKAYRKYTTHLRRVNGFEPFKYRKGGK